MMAMLLLWLAVVMPAAAADSSYSSAYTAVGEALMSTKKASWAESEQALAVFAQQWEQLEKPAGTHTEAVDQAFAAAQAGVRERDQAVTLEQLKTLSKAFLEFDRMMHPLDEAAVRSEVGQSLSPPLDALAGSIASQDQEALAAAYKKLQSVWTKKEAAVRSLDMKMYGQIESRLGILRISTVKEPPSYEEISSRYEALREAVELFAEGTEPAAAADEGSYSLSSLTGLLRQSVARIGEGKPQEAAGLLEQFLIAWPAVEGEVSTRDGSMYRALETHIPLIAGKLSSPNAAFDALSAQLSGYADRLEQLQQQGYTVWDAALVLLREGMEALLIISALLAFLERAGYQRYRRWIWLGAGAGVLASIAAAFTLNALFSTATAGANREIIEGVVGIAAVVMMLGVGIWLHQKSRMQGWTRYLNRQMGAALSAGSVVSMAVVSFLAIFREGAETIIFYMGMAATLTTSRLLAGMAIAVVILAVCAVVFIRYSAKLPLGPFFKAATLLIYILAFKMLGVSLHALQLTGKLPTTQALQMSAIELIGLYPTWETLLPQLGLLMIIVCSAIVLARRGR
ncbi:FTR1 family iron permease [Paenibacillus sp. SYP-B4298]|uniref:FTR1 family iron permease n=1 Tax=Paenibacillus sp. SYP-B4298 TaxID=2996034 RepID=UPI0022DDD388|nr:FTR1 family protein [Paenibacillus sp. SYP-B4298]